MRSLRPAALAVVLLAAAIMPAMANERITRFVSDVDVQRNGDLLVTETIAVQAEGQVIKRGILRDFPTRYTNKNGTHVEVAFDVQSVMRDGASERFATERLSNGVRVRIGSADKILDPGPHEFVIKYRTSRQVGFFGDFDELYWNATGNGWTFPIDAAEARIRLPDAVPFKQNAFYTGPQGAKDKNAYVFEQRPGLIVFRTTQALPPNNGLTVAAGWQKGIITPPSQASLLGNWFQDNLPLAAAGSGLLLVLGYYLSAWKRVGHDPQRGTIIPLFGPPKGMSPAAVRYVSRMAFDNKVFTAAIVDLGVQGHIKLVEKKTSGLQIVPRTGGKPLAPDEQAVAGSLFGKRASPINLDQSSCSILQRAQAALKDSLAKAYADRLFHDNKSWSIRGLLTSLAVIAAVIVSVFAGWGIDQGAATIIGMLSLMPALIVITVLLIVGWPRSIAGYVFLAIGGVFSFIVGSGGYQMITENYHGWTQAVPAALPLVLVPLASSAFTWMKAFTVEGRQVADQIEGFRQYLGVAEEDRLNALNPPEKTPELFERFLPYAIALDVENAWATRFAEVLAAASVAAVADSWYSNNSGHDRTSDPGSFATYLGSSLSQTISSASTPPGSSGSSDSSSSSGSDGGGSSGDGGGGGGGSGW